MASTSSPKLVVENDSFLRLIQVILDPAAPTERFAAFAHFCRHDLPDFRGWCERIRAHSLTLYPADVRMVDDDTELLANAPGAVAIVVESLGVGAKEIVAAGSARKIVQKYGGTTPRIDSAACPNPGLQDLSLRPRRNISPPAPR